MSFWNKTKEVLLGLPCGRGDHRSHSVSDFEGTPTCEDCKKAILWVRAQEEALDKDPPYGCPHCLSKGKKSTMQKDFIFPKKLMIQDICTECNSVFLSPDELKALNDHFYSKGYSKGRSSAQDSGMATGFVIGSMMN